MLRENKRFICFIELKMDMKDSLTGRGRLIFDWIPYNIGKILDVGCAYGYDLIYYSKKCKGVFGVDPNEELIKKAKLDYPNIEFRVGPAENLPFKDKTFDLVIMGDVLEHVDDEVKSLSEAYRVLKKEGILIITAPHKGLFSFMDIDNYSWYYRKLFGIKTNKPGYQNKHRHYSLRDLKKLFQNRFEIIDCHRSSLFLLPFILNLRLLIRHVFGEKTETEIKPYLNKIMDFDFSVRYGKLSYCIGIKAKKI